MRHYEVEFKRAFFSIKFLFGVLGVSFTQFFSIYRVSGIKGSVYSTYDVLICLVPYISCIIFCAIPYAQSFCDDLEYNYIQQLLLRLNLKKYVLLRMLLICLSSNIVMIIGTSIFVCIIHFKIPWVDQWDSFNNDYIMKSINENHVLYYMIRAFFYGLPASCMSLLASYISLFWKNKMLVLASPFLIYSLITFYINDIFVDVFNVDINKIFNPSYNIWHNKFCSMIGPIIISFLFACIIGFLIHKKLRCMCYEEG